MARETVIEVIGADRVAASLDAARMRAALGRALYLGGLAVQAEMRRAAKPHHFTGRLERTITTTPPEDRGSGLEVRVGIPAAAAPEGRPLAFGWRSSAGKQPPTEAIVHWLKAKGASEAAVARRSGMAFRTARDPEAALRSRAFLVARAIGRRGYRFGSDDWFHKGIAAGGPKLRAILREAIHDRAEGGPG